METTIKVIQSGNSLGIRIPKWAAEALGIAKDSVLRMTTDGEKITLEPTRPRRARSKRIPLSEYVAKMTPENSHPEVPTGAAQGNEAL